ncbi:MAG: hypothetical protein JNL21_27555 [Myxococcales bacterium]|nr:hypothetical protein [Myxococcales bacterium]
MAKPTKHYGRWRIRWTDEKGDRRSAVYDDYKVAAHELRQRETEVEERRRGLRPAALEPKSFTDIADYWEQNRAPLKRSYKDDLSILKQLRAAFGQLGLAATADWLPAVDRYLAAATGRLSPKTIANHLVLLGTILRLAIELEWMPAERQLHLPSDDNYIAPSLEA